MGVIYFIGNVLLSIVLSLAASMIDRRIQNRKKKKSPSDQSKGS